MATIKTPVEKFSGIVAGVHFADGVGETDDDNAIAYFERQGYGVDRPAEKPDEQTPADSLSKLTVTKLKKYAEDKGIDLGEASSKAEILVAIEKAASPAGLQKDADVAEATAVEAWLKAEKEHNDSVGGLSE